MTSMHATFGLALSSLAIAVFAIVSYAFQVGDLVEGRAAGGAGDPNLFAAYQVVALPIAVTVAVHAKTPLRRALAYGSAAVILASVFTSLSRGGPPARRLPRTTARPLRATALRRRPPPRVRRAPSASSSRSPRARASASATA